MYGLGLPAIETPQPPSPLMPLRRGAGSSPASPLPRACLSWTCRPGAAVPPGAADVTSSPSLPLISQCLLRPWTEEIFSLSPVPRFLRRFGRETIGIFFDKHSSPAAAVALFSARQPSSRCEPDIFNKWAGLISITTREWPLPLHFARTKPSSIPRVLSCLLFMLTRRFTSPSPFPAGKPLIWRVEVDVERLHFSYPSDGHGNDLVLAASTI